QQPYLQQVSTAYALFPHQRQAAREVSGLLHDGPRRVVLHMPTGGGKTRTAMSLVADHLRRQEPTLALWLAHGQELLEQAAAEFESAWSKLGNPAVPVVRMWGSSPANVDGLTDGMV